MCHLVLAAVVAAVAVMLQRHSGEAAALLATQRRSDKGLARQCSEGEEARCIRPRLPKTPPGPPPGLPHGHMA